MNHVLYVTLLSRPHVASPTCSTQQARVPRNPVQRLNRTNQTTMVAVVDRLLSLLLKLLVLVVVLRRPPPPLLVEIASFRIVAPVIVEVGGGQRLLEL